LLGDGWDSARQLGHHDGRFADLLRKSEWGGCWWCRRWNPNQQQLHGRCRTHYRRDASATI